ncbi:PQQ-binding-like beta-propeller repeat protein [Propionibacteriaceae bacterium Y2011]
MKLTRREFTLSAGAAVGLGLIGAPVMGPPRAVAEDIPPDHPDVVRFTSQDPAIGYVGQPVNSQIGARAPRIGQEDGRWVEYQVYKGSPSTELPGTFVVTDIVSGDVVRSIKLPTAEACSDLTIATDGKVYMPSYPDGHGWQYDPATKQVTDLGLINAAGTRISPFGAGFGPDGIAYFGIYPNSHLHRYEPATGTIRDLGTVDPDEGYIHFICWDPGSNAIFCSLGGQRASVWRIEDAGLGAKTKIIDGSDVPILDTVPFLGALDCVNGHLVVRTEGRLVVAALDGTIEYYTGDKIMSGYHVVPSRDGSGFFFSSFGGINKYDLATHSYTATAGTVRSYFAHAVHIDDTHIAGTDGGGVFVVDLVSGERTEHTPSFRQPTKIQKIFRGPGDTLYASGYMKGLAKINTDGGEPNFTVNQGQYESWIVRDGLMYLGAYGYSKFYRYDPATPTVNPKQLFTSAPVKQDRPFAMAYDPVRDEAYMGSVPLYGQNQGALAIYEFATGKVTHLTDEIATDQSIISVAHNPHDGLLYIGTTIDGGMGMEPISLTTEGQLIVFDPATRTVVRRSVPVADRQGVTGLLVDPDGSVWGVAEEQLIKVSPDGGVQTLGAVSGRYAPDPSHTWAWAYLNWSAMDGHIYGSAGGYLFRIDPASGAITRLANGGTAWAATDTVGDVYFAYRTHLFKYQVPYLVSGPPNDTQKCQAVNAYAQGRGVRFPDGYKPQWKAIFDRIEQRVANGETAALRDEYCAS